MRKPWTRRSEARVRVRSSGGILMVRSYVRLKNMYKEDLSLTYPRRESIVKGSGSKSKGVCRAASQC